MAAGPKSVRQIGEELFKALALLFAGCLLWLLRDKPNVRANWLEWVIACILSLAFARLVVLLDTQIKQFRLRGTRLNDNRNEAA